MNLGNVDVMKRITKIAVVENATAIWEYDPSLPGNRVLGGSLDVIAAIRTLAIKVSGVSTNIIHPVLLLTFSFRSKHLANESSTSIPPRAAVELLRV
jgi:hypothetical protein